MQQELLTPSPRRLGVTGAAGSTSPTFLSMPISSVIQPLSQGPISPVSENVPWIFRKPLGISQFYPLRQILYPPPALISPSITTVNMRQNDTEDHQEFSMVRNKCGSRELTSASVHSKR
jgi:hypothetical protein